jgi:hypothetical protein
MRLTDWLSRLGLRARTDAAPLRKQLRGLSDRLAAHRRTLEEVSREVGEQHQTLTAAIARLEESRLQGLEQSFGAIESAARRRVSHGAATLLAHRGTLGEVFSRSRVLRMLSVIAQSSRPILAGPWTGDVALEQWYWVPFLRWFAEQFRVPPAQLHVISRGAAPWYTDIASTYTDILSLYSASEFRARTARVRGRGFYRFEREIVRRVRGASGGDQVVLHPLLMLRLFAPFWNHDAPVEHVIQHTSPRRTRPLRVPVSGLPARFIAVRFAFSQAFPDTAANRQRLDDLLGLLTRSQDVVWLDPTLAGVDGADQVEYLPPAQLPVHRVPELLDLRRSLEVTAAIMAAADAYVGTYGALAHIAASYGVKSVAFYSVRGFFPHHRRVADHILGEREHDSFLVLNIADAALLRSVLGSVNPVL